MMKTQEEENIDIRELYFSDEFLEFYTHEKVE